MGTNKSGSGTGAGRAFATGSVKNLLKNGAGADEVCVEIARIFQVRATEVALLRLDGALLRFLFPPELKTSGTIPVTSSSAVAANTAATKTTEIFNEFSAIKHARVFETVHLEEDAGSERLEQPPIQKLISAPILDPQAKVLGVLQISRKAYHVAESGADFGADHQKGVEAIASILAAAAFLQ